MPSITNRTGQLFDPVLSNVGRNYGARFEGIADIVSPRVQVSTEVGKYNVWDSYSAFADDDDPLVPDRAETKEIDLAVSQEAYIAEEYAFKVSVSAREERQADNSLNLRSNKVRAARNRLLRARERRVAALLNTVDAGGELDNSMDATPSNNWNVDAGTIEADILTAKEAIYDAIGYEPNTIVIPYKVANAISVQQDIRDIFKYTVDGRQLLGAGANILPPEIWGLRVLIPRAKRATTAEGATVTTSDTWGSDVRVLYVNPSASTEEPSVSYTFQARGPEVRTWQENDPNVTYIRQSDGIYDEKVVAPFAGYVIKAVL
jgi:hypothetical protein